MSKQLEKNIIVILLTVVLIILNIFDDKITQTINIQNYQLSLNSTIIAIVLILINLVKSTKLLSLSFNFSRLSNIRLITILTYYFYISTVLTIFIYNRDITLLFAIIMIFSEIALVIFNLMIYNVTNKNSFNPVLLRIKDGAFLVMSLAIFSNNIPFVQFSIPFDLFFMLIYIGINLYIIESLYEEYRKIVNV